jgi:hypothetical protein
VSGAPICAACSKAHFELEVTGATALGDVGKCGVCRRLTRFRFTPVNIREALEEIAADAAPSLPPTSRDVGEPFGVVLSAADGYHSVSVRNAAGIVAYVHVGLESADAARWAALSWLRGQQRDVCAADAPILAERFRVEALSYEAPTVTPVSADDDPHAALCVLAAKIPEALFDRLGLWLQARERTWEDLADEATAPDAIGEAKYVADVELAQVFGAIGGAL